MTPDLVIVGNLLVDDLVYDDGRTQMAQAGGALLHAALGATLWGARVGLVGIVGTDYPKDALDRMTAKGISLAGLHRLDGPGARVWLLYENGTRRMIPWLGRPSHGDVSPLPEQVPAAYRAARGMHVAPMPFEHQRAIVEAFGHGDRLVSIDPCERLSTETLPAFRGLSRHIDVLFLSDDEIDLANKDDALRALATGRTRYVLEKRGRHGGLVHDARQSRPIAWDARQAHEIDPTGAGDAFAAAFMCALLERLPLDRALARAAATAAVAVEGVGAASLWDTTQADVSRRAG